MNVPSAAQMMRWIETVVAEGVRRPGYPADDRVARWAAGCSPSWPTARAPRHSTSRRRYGRPCRTNVTGTLPGRSDQWVIVASHHDAPWASAVEDASGVALVPTADPEPRWWFTTQDPRLERLVHDTLVASVISSGRPAT